MMVGSRPRRTPPFLVWLILGIIGCAVLASVILGLLASRRAAQVQVLQTEVASLRAERQTTQNALAALQGTATALENRVKTLEANDPGEQLATLQKAVEGATKPEEVAALQDSVSRIQARLDAFQGTLDDLSAKIEDQTGDHSSGPLPAETRLMVTPRKQTHNLSCESSAASMAASYFGLDLSEEQILAALPRNPNPYLGFRGNPDGPTGGIQDYGVYSGPIMDVLNSHGLRAWSVEGGLNGIKAAIARGDPVIAWITYNVQVSAPVIENIGGQSVPLVPDQHTVLVTGYDAEGVWANDPWEGQEDYYSNADFQRALSYFGDMAIEVAAGQ